MDEDKKQELLNDMKGNGQSDCCGWGTYGDLLICEHCGEHCEDIKNTLCVS